MTDQELKDLVASLAVQSRETDRLFKETRLQMQETDRKMQETDRKMQEMFEKWDKAKDQMTGINDNIGQHAEQYFQNALAETLIFGGVKYDMMIPNLSFQSNGTNAEFDIVLVNGESVAVIEVKNRIHPKFVKALAEEKLAKFKKYFKEYGSKKIYLGVAGFSFNKEVAEQAKKYGIGIIRQVGKSIEIDAKKLKAY